jgi:hypothetical protein
VRRSTTRGTTAQSESQAKPIEEPQAVAGLVDAARLEDTRPYVFVLLPLGA